MCACVYTRRKESHYVHRVEKHSTKWKGCLPHNLNIRATLDGSSEQSSSQSSWGHKWGKIPSNQDILPQRFQSHTVCLFVCLEEARPIQLQHKPSLQPLGPWDRNWLTRSLYSPRPCPPAPSAMISRGPSMPLGEPLPCHTACAHSFPKMKG